MKVLLDYFNRLNNLIMDIYHHIYIPYISFYKDTCKLFITKIFISHSILDRVAIEWKEYNCMNVLLDYFNKLNNIIIDIYHLIIP